VLYASDVVNVPGHVIATFLQLDYSLAAVASLPALLLGHLYQAVGLLVLGAFALRVELAVAEYADLGVARAAACVLASVCRVHLDLGRFDPLATPFRGAV
jgi:hypothetical protein